MSVIYRCNYYIIIVRKVANHIEAFAMVLNTAEDLYKIISALTGHNYTVIPNLEVTSNVNLFLTLKTKLLKDTRLQTPITKEQLNSGM